MNDDQVRELLDSAVADVQPRRGLDEIRRRTVVRRSRRRHWAWAGAGVLAAGAATVAVVAATGLGSTSVPAPADTTAATRDVPVYFVGDTGAGPRLFREVESVPDTVDGGLARSLDAALLGTAADPDYRSGWPAATRLRYARLVGDHLSVDLSGAPVTRPAGLGAVAAEVALQQLVYTAQAAAGTDAAVTFLLDGRPVDSLLGMPTGRPVAAAGRDEVLAPVSVAEPADGSAVDSPFTVTGEAAAFEANVQWELMRGDTVVRHGFTTARECCTLSPYTFTVTAPPGRYTLLVHDEDASGGEGTPPSVDSKTFIVR